MHLFSRAINRTVLATLTCGLIWPVSAAPTMAQTTGTLSASPSTVVAGSSTTLSASGFTPGETVTLLGPHFNGPPPVTVTASSSGAISDTLSITPLVPSGTYVTSATGASSGFVAVGSLGVTASSAAVVVSPGTVQAGSQVAITATGFDPGETVNVTGPFSNGLSKAANSSGQVSFTGTVSSLASPATYAVSARGGTTTRFPGTTLVVTPYSATVSAADATVPAGHSTTLSATGFLPNEQVVIDAPGAHLVLTADGLGAASGPITPPFWAAPSADYTLTAAGATSGRISRATMAIAAPTTSLSVSPSKVSAGDSVTVSISGFQPNEALFLNGPPQIGGSFSTDATGNFTASLPVGAGVPAGSYSVNVAGGSGGFAEAQLSVADPNPAPALALSPASLLAGQTVVVSGSGFAPGEQLRIDRLGPPVTALADGNGNFSLSMPAFGVGSSVPNGGVDVLATGLTSNYQAQGVVNVTARPATLSVSPATVAAGSPVTVQVANEPGGINVFGFDNVSAAGFTNVPGTFVTVDANGSGQATLTIPANASPGHFLVGGGGAGGVSPVSTALTITTSAPVVSFAPSTVAEGSPATLAGSGFAPGETISISGGGGSVFLEIGNANGLLKVPADGNGAFSTPMTPKLNVPGGARLVNVSGSVTRQALTATLNVQGFSPSLSVSPNPVQAGGTLTLTGSGFPPGGSLNLGLAGAGSLATAVPRPDGTFSASGVVPNVLPGDYAASARTSGPVSGSPTLAIARLTIQAGTPGTLTASATTADGKSYAAGSWTNQNVTVAFTCSGIATCPPTQTFSNEGGGQTASASATDLLGNSIKTSFGPIDLDRTSPVVTYSGNAGSYTIDQTVAIACTASDPPNGNGTAGSGIAASTCQNVAGAAYTFSIGKNSFSATATDKAGNSGSGSTSFTLAVNVAGLDKLIGQFVTNSGVASSLQDQAASIASAPNPQAKAGKLGAFSNLLNAQTGKSITSTQAALLIKLAGYL